MKINNFLNFGYLEKIKPGNSKIRQMFEVLSILKFYGMLHEVENF
jgi:hypothetical protein